jgi:hypothetical protein
MVPRRAFMSRGLSLTGLGFAGLTTSGVGLGLFGGCANWKDEGQGKNSILQQPSLSSNTVIVEIAFVRVTQALSAPIHDLWQRTDEQHLSVEARRELYANGFRSGTMGTELPSVLRQGLDEQKVTVEDVAINPATLANPTMRQYRLQCRAGKLIPLPVSPDFRDRTMSIREEGILREQEFSDCQCVMELEAAPLANGMASVHLMPMVEFGEAKNRPVGTDGVWQVGVRKQFARFPNLAVSMELRPGETVLLTATDPPQGVGGAFFGGGVFSGRPDEAPSSRRLMLIRLAQTRGDGVFEARSAPPN